MIRQLEALISLACLSAMLSLSLSSLAITSQALSQSREMLSIYSSLSENISSIPPHAFYNFDQSYLYNGCLISSSNKYHGSEISWSFFASNDEVIYVSCGEYH